MTPEVTTRLDGDHGRSEDRRAGRRRSTRRAWACRRPRSPLERRHGELQGQDRGRRPDDPDLDSRARSRSRAANWVVTDTRQAADGRGDRLTTLDKATLVVAQAHRSSRGRSEIERGLQGRQGHRHLRDGRRSPSRSRSTSAATLFADGVGVGRRAGLAAARRGLQRRPTATSTCSSRRSQLKQAKVTARRERHRPRRHLPGLEGRGHVGGGRARPDDDLDRPGLAQGREGQRDPARRWAARW